MSMNVNNEFSDQKTRAIVQEEINRNLHLIVPKIKEVIQEEKDALMSHLKLLQWVFGILFVLVNGFSMTLVWRTVDILDELKESTTIAETEIKELKNEIQHLKNRVQ